MILHSQGHLGLWARRGKLNDCLQGLEVAIHLDLIGIVGLTLCVWLGLLATSRDRTL